MTEQQRRNEQYECEMWNRMWNVKSRNRLKWQSSRGGATKGPVFLSAPQSSLLHLHLSFQILLLGLQLLLSKSFPGRLRSTTFRWGRGTQRHRLASLASRSEDSVQFLIKLTAFWLNLACEGECSKTRSNNRISFCSQASCFHLKLDITWNNISSLHSVCWHPLGLWRCINRLQYIESHLPPPHRRCPQWRSNAPPNQTHPLATRCSDLTIRIRIRIRIRPTLWQPNAMFWSQN